MSDRIVKNDFSIQIDRSVVFHLLDCYEDSPVYTQMVEEFEDKILYVMSLLQPRAIYCFKEREEYAEFSYLCNEQSSIYVLLTLGSAISDFSSRLFQEHDALGGMMVDAMADACLYAMQEQLAEELHRECQKREVGVSRRLDAPAQIPMHMQKTILDVCKADSLLGVWVTEGFMFGPVKTIGYVLMTTLDQERFQVEHNCRTCKAVNCNMRNIKPVTVTVIDEQEQEQEQFVCEGEQTIMELLRNSKRSYSFACGGNGTCGSCKIKVLSGTVGISAEDQKFFREEELAEGYRLACKAVPQEDCTIF